MHHPAGRRHLQPGPRRHGDGRRRTTPADRCRRLLRFSAGQYNGDLAKKWIKYCQTAIPIDKSGSDSFGHWEYTHYYYAQAVYILGDDGYAKLFPQSKPENRLTWSKYREVTFAYLLSRQASDGSWTQGHIGTVFTTACHLTILQLDNGTLPIYQR